MYKMNADEARTLMLETEARIAMLLQHFEQETGLTVAGISLEYADRFVGQPRRSQQPVQRVELEVVLL